MPPERNFPPSARPPRDRYNFGAGAGGGGGARRPFTPGGGGPRPPFRPMPPPPEPLHTVRLREGDREAEISGSPEFVRQTLDDLPNLFARLRGEHVAPRRPASISMPPPPSDGKGHPDATPVAAAHTHDDEDDDADAHETPAQAHAQPPREPHRRERHTRKPRTLEEQVFDVLAGAGQPMSVAAIRQRLGGEATGQQIRRLLERASDRVVATDERPAGYALR